MRPRYTQRFLRSLSDAPPQIQKAFEKQSDFLLQNLSHPSLRAKKHDETHGIWQARVTRDWRFYFQVEGDTYLFLDIKRHPK